MKRIIICLFFSFVFLRAGDLCAADGKFLFDVRIEFMEGGSVSSRLWDGREFDLGRVVRLPEKTRWPSYTASAWGEPSSVAASAVNALHILIGVENGQGRTMSVIPRETIAPAAGAGASVVLDSAAGTGLFGAWAPPVGTRIFVEASDGAERALSDGLPEPGETMIFRVFEDYMPYMVEIENRPTGRVIAWSRSGPNMIARVIRPLAGVGRFEGTLFQDAGRIRANHSGVIDVSTCERGKIGGFQIIPWDHALNSKEMQGSWQMTQWLIIGPPDGKSMMGGTHPLFSGGLVPGTSKSERLWDIWSTYGRKPLVMARLDGGEWGLLPKKSGRDDAGMASVTHIRIYFPITAEPLADQ